MRILSNIGCRIVMTWLCVAGLAVAQQPAAASISFQAVYFDPRETEAPAIYAAANGARELIEVDKGYLTGPYKADLREGRVADFYASEDQQLPTTSVPIPELGTSKLLLIFIPSAESFRVLPIGISDARFGGGGSLIVNATASEVGIRQGNGDLVRIEPGKHQVLPSPGGDADAMIPVQIFERRVGQEEWEIAQSTRWAADDRFRSYLFFYRGDGPRLMLHGIQERIDGTDQGAD